MSKRVNPGPLRVSLNGLWQGTLLDISEHGALVWLLTELTEKQVTLQIEWKGETVPLPSRIVRSRPHRVQSRTEYDVAFEFLILAPDAVTVLKHIVQNS